MEPEDLRDINAVNTRQRVVAVMVALDVNHRHVSMQLMQQAEPFPEKPGSEGLADLLSAQPLLARFANAASERVVADTDLRLRPVAIPRLADHFLQAVVRDLLCRSFKQATVPLLPCQVIAVVVLQVTLIPTGGLTSLIINIVHCRERCLDDTVNQESRNRCDHTEYPPSVVVGLLQLAVISQRK